MLCLRIDLIFNKCDAIVAQSKQLGGSSFPCIQSGGSKILENFCINRHTGQTRKLLLCILSIPCQLQYSVLLNDKRTKKRKNSFVTNL